jgi:predicted transcriptional regulator
MNKEERDKLKNQVTDMVRTGYSYSAIGYQLGISKRTIVSYVKEERKEAIERMHATAEEHMADFEKDKEKRIQKLWTIALDETKKAGERTKAIALLQNEEMMSIKRKQLIGLLPPEPPQIAIQNTNVLEGVTTIADSIRRNYPEMIQKFIHNKARLINERKEDSESNQAELIGETKKD